MAKAVLQIRLFGGLDLRYDGNTVPPPSSTRATSLLVYLVLHRHAPQSREWLAFLLWPDSTESQARTNLRHVLHNLRRTLPGSDRYLAATPQTLQWRSDAPCWIDVDTFDRLATQVEVEPEDQRLSLLQNSVALYTGELLPGWYDDWLVNERGRLSQQYLHLLERLVDALESRGELAEAIQHAEQLLRQDHLNEGSYRLLMRLYAAQGDRARALRVFHVCVTTLRRELDVEPSELTHAAYEALLPEAFEPAAEVPVGGTAMSLVGRAKERSQLAGLWRSAEHGNAICVLLSGESGVGKTRLAEEMRTWCTHRGAIVAAARSYAAEGALAYAPVVAWLRSEALVEHRQTLSPTVLAELSRLLPELTTHPPGDPNSLQLSEAERRHRLFDALVKAILVVDEPMLLVVDDIHWSDRETIQFLHYLLRARPDSRLLLLVTARHEELDAGLPVRELMFGLQALDRYTEIEITRFAASETATLAEQLAGRTLAPDEIELLHRDTEGNPLFIVEAMRAGWANGDTPAGWISPRIQAVIEARLAKLSDPAGEVAAIAATIGRDFTIDMLRLVSGHDDQALIGCLDELWQRRIVREQGLDGYDFTHDKLREVAYSALSPARRRHTHLLVARALEQLHANDPTNVSGQLAAHYEHAGAGDEATGWYLRAAEAAQHMHAYSEAIRLLQRGIDLIRALPSTPARQARELEMLTAIPGPLVAIMGFHSDYGDQIHQRAMALSLQLGVEPEPPLIWSMAASNLVRGNLDDARTHGYKLRARGEQDGDDVLVVQGEYVLGIASYWYAEFLAAERHFETVLTRFKPSDRRTHLLRYGNDPAIICQMRLACVRWFLGRTMDARRLRDEAFNGALAHDDWFTKLGILHFVGLLSIEIGDYEYVRTCAAVLAEISVTHPTEFVQHNGEAIVGFVDVLDGRHEAGIQRITRALDDLLDRNRLPGQRASVARVLLAAHELIGEPLAGLDAANRLLTAGVGARIWEAEALRARAEYSAAIGAEDDTVEAEFDLALRTARRDQSRAIELRVAASLLRYRLTRDNPSSIESARDRLAGLAALVSDGNETADLRAATALLARS